MALEKIMPDDINEVACAMLAYIEEQDRQAGAKMSYGDFGKLLQKDYGRNHIGVSGPDECSIEATRQSIHISTLSGNEYELTWNKIAKFIHPYLKSTTVSETVETDTPTGLQNTPTDTAPAFDYSMLDYDTANYLRKATARVINSYADIGAVLAEAQELLANNKNGVFEKWYSSLGLSKRVVYRFIQVHEYRKSMLISCQNGTISENAIELFDNLPKTLQADISSPSAPAEAVNAVLSGDITTHKDFIAMKKELEESQAENEQLTEKNRFLSMDYTHEKERNERMLDELKEFREKSDALALELKEARSEAREVIMTDPTESEEYIELDNQNTELARANDELHLKVDDLTDEIEELKSALDDAQNVTVPPADDFNTVREFFESSYARALNAMQEVYDYMKPRKYSAKVNKYARERIDSLKQHIRNLETFYEDDDDYDDEEEA